MLEDYDIKTLTASAGASRRIIQRSLNDLQLRRSQATRDDVYIPTRAHRVSPLVMAKSAHGFYHNTDNLTLLAVCSHRQQTCTKVSRNEKYTLSLAPRTRWRALITPGDCRRPGT